MSTTLPIVMKFGGTSVEHARAISTVCSLIERQCATNSPVLIVVSACAGVTNALLRIVRTAASGNRSSALDELELLRARHEAIATDLLQDSRETVLAGFRNDSEVLCELVKGIAALKEATPRAFDQCASFGELWSSTLVYSALRDRGVEAAFQDAREVLTTNAEYQRAVPETAALNRNCAAFLVPKLAGSRVVVTQGFIGATAEGVTTTIGRGGSDYSASLFGAALKAKEIQIWTDVDGILTADPSVVPSARNIRAMSFDEAAELAYFGARVLHPSTILPAIAEKIPVRVLNSRKADLPGTLITSENGRPGVVKSVAYKEGISVITIRSTRMLMNHGFLASVFDVFRKYRKSVDVVATSEVGISLTVDNADDLEALVRELEVTAVVRVERERAVVCVVGEGLRRTKGIAASVFASLEEAGVNVELISHGGSEINITFVIREADIAPAVRSLHNRFFGRPDVLPVERDEEEEGARPVIAASASAV